MRSGRATDEDADDLTAIWIITYSDMVTLLLAFFLLMYSFNLVGERRRREMTEAVRRDGEVSKVEEDLDKTARDIAEKLERSGEKGVWLDATETEITIGLPSGVFFASGQATLNPAAAAQLAEVGASLARLPNSIRVEGHTDNVPMRGGDFPSNWHLSVARAQAVVRVLLAAGVAPERLEVVGHADGRPRASNATEAGRAQNRRIEVKLVRR